MVHLPRFQSINHVHTDSQKVRIYLKHEPTARFNKTSNKNIDKSQNNKSQYFVKTTQRKLLSYNYSQNLSDRLSFPNFKEVF